MPKARLKQHRGLPVGWRFKNGAYRYRVPIACRKDWDNKAEFTLGKTTPEAYKTWASRLEKIEAVKTVGQLLDRYALEVIPTKAIVTQRGNERALKRIRAVFGHMGVGDVGPQDVYKYNDARESKVNARQEINLLSHAYTKAVEWGYLRRHPFKGEVRLPGLKPRTRYIEDWEILEALALQPDPSKKRGSVLAIQAYVRLKLLTGMRQTDLLRIKIESLQADGLHVTPQKSENSTGKRLIYKWTPPLRQAVDLALLARQVDIGPYLFCNRRGECYINEKTGRPEGWASMWGRFMDRLLAETEIKERFTEHDIRAKAASDSESDESAMRLLAHADVKITRRVYRRKPEIIQPNEGKLWDKA